MDEQLLHYIWKHKLFNKDKLQTRDGQKVQLISLGEHNHDAGPDFFNGRIKIADTEWAGSIEIHMRSSDWFLHGHDNDAAYNNVILHVVGVNDAEITRQNHTVIPTVELPYDKRLASNYNMLAKSRKWIPCEDHFAQVDPLIRSMWSETLLIQRLQRKSEVVTAMMAQTNNDLDEVFFRMLCRNMGFKINTQPFEQLSRKINLRQIRTLGNDQRRIEALLLGTAGFLESPESDYEKTLKKEFNHLAARFKIEPLEAKIWKFARMRPVSFPTIRLAQLANLLSRNTQFTQMLKKANSIKEATMLFSAEVSDFWETHYTFSKKSKKLKKPLGIKSIENIIINSVFPFLFVVGKYYDDQEMQKKIFSWMRNLPEEKNRIIERWKKIGAEMSSAYDSQAYLELYNEFCSKNRCLDCRLGGYIIKEM
ncbi:DUF2851 family protein [Salinivirga cyanobacteriivorans]|nr:DUF2851 family protein [Salinivirga cyanobacteriivorans]